MYDTISSATRVGLLGAMMIALVACGGSDDDGAASPASNSAADASGEDAARGDSGVAEVDAAVDTREGGEDSGVAEMDAAAGDDALGDDVAVEDDVAVDDDVALGDVADADATSDVGEDTRPESDVCEGEECPPDCELECPAEQRRCEEDGGVSVCTLDAVGCSRWVRDAPCAEDRICQLGECVVACSDEETRCLDSTTRQICREGLLEQERCPGGCDPVTRACFVCPDGAWRCEDDGDRVRLERCEGGSRWLLQDVCQECGCAAGEGGVVMQCRFVRDDTPTDCTQCTEDGTTCLP